MKSDSQLEQDVRDELHWDPSVNEAEIAIAVKGGVVTLLGGVSDYAQKLAAERAVTRVSGVRTIAEELKVRLPNTTQRTDREIAQAALGAMAWSTAVQKDRVTLKVEQGWVTLDGTLEWYYQRQAAEDVVRGMLGVMGVTNLIRVMPKASKVEVKSKIENALKRSAEIDSQRINVEAINGKVTLKGSVRSWAERRDAELAAWAAPGVADVDDLLTVTG
ncbi:MAG TPA: BON domain-containing protein [Gemmatimonadaceae bacterium]|nr:BON domain-containing protein [Gemmatimonadaceae bacterium]